MGSTATDSLPQQASLAERWRVWRWRHRQTVLAFTILTPLFLYLLLFTWVPIVVMAALSVTEWNIVRWPLAFVGLDNYIEIFTTSYYQKLPRTTDVSALTVLVMEIG